MSRRHVGSLPPFNKVCDLSGDTEALAPYYEIIEHLPEVLANQHAIRKWEYGMALRAIDGWPPLSHDALQICDVGGAGSGFWRVLHRLHTVPEPPPILVIDAAAPHRVWRDGEPVQYWPESVEQFATHVAHDQFDVVTCISVIEHVEQVRPFLRAIRMLLKPGGLLFLTTDYCDADGPDVYHFHWMRQRIYNAERVQRLLQDAREIGFQSFGASDWKYPGPMVYDYSVAAVALTRKGSVR